MVKWEFCFLETAYLRDRYPRVHKIPLLCTKSVHIASIYILWQTILLDWGFYVCFHFKLSKMLGFDLVYQQLNFVYNLLWSRSTTVKVGFLNPECQIIKSLMVLLFFNEMNHFLIRTPIHCFLKTNCPMDNQS